MSKLSAAALPIKTDLNTTILSFFEHALTKGVFDAVVIPIEVPAKDAFMYVLVKDIALLKTATPIPPVMFVQGAKALSSITRCGDSPLKIAAVMRPCELRAAHELQKLSQVNLDHITLCSYDCPGVLPTSDYLENPAEGKKTFAAAMDKGSDDMMRPVCQIDDKSSMIVGDLHFGSLAMTTKALPLLAHTSKGHNVLTECGYSLKESVKSWQDAVAARSKEKQKKRTKAHADIQKMVGGIENLVDTFSTCINCHNCMRVCPVCACRLCYFDSDKVKHRPDDYLDRAVEKGSMRFLPDTALFQMGRMMHMSLSCVSCGSCEDACPMSIPVGQIFSMIADKTQEVYDYVSGRSPDEPIPLMMFKEEELHEVEGAHD